MKALLVELITFLKCLTLIVKFSTVNSRAVEALIFFKTLINALLMHPGPSRRRVGGKLPWVPRRLRGPPVEYRKLKTRLKIHN